MLFIPRPEHSRPRPRINIYAYVPVYENVPLLNFCVKRAISGQFVLIVSKYSASKLSRS